MNLVAVPQGASAYFELIESQRRLTSTLRSSSAAEDEEAGAVAVLQGRELQGIFVKSDWFA